MDMMTTPSTSPLPTQPSLHQDALPYAIYDDHDNDIDDDSRTKAHSCSTGAVTVPTFKPMDPHLREARQRLNQELDKLRIVTAAYVESIWDEYVQGKKESKKDVDVLLGKINEIQRDPTLSRRERELAIANLKNKRQKIDAKAAEDRSLTISTTESTYKHCKIISLPGFHSRLLDEVDTMVEAKQWEAFKKNRAIPAAVGGAVATPSSLTDDSRLVQPIKDGSSAMPAAEELAGGTQVDDDDDDNSAGKFVCFKIGCHIM